MSPSVLDSIVALRSTLLESIPYCSGTLAVEQRDLLLYYGKDEIARRIDLSNASVEQLDHLSRACQPATFGMDERDILDESYRKAGKMDKDGFLVGLDPLETGLLNVVQGGLFQGTQSTKTIKAELYKLNVYGKDAFFKSHKDTPRAENMFGSLVIVFPTPHEGGALMLRHEDKEWRFDSGAVLSAAGNSCSIAFVAFLSDVDHEVTPVLSGHRITVTYNLYFPLVERNLPSASQLSVDRPIGSSISGVQSALATILGDATFLPNGGTLGFGLRHQYPLPKTWSEGDPNPLTNLENWLKGSDAALFQACRSLNLYPLLRLAYEDRCSKGGGTSYVLMDHAIDFHYDLDGNHYRYMCESKGGVRMYYLAPTRDTEVSTGKRRTPKYATEENERASFDKDKWQNYPDWRTVTVQMVTEMTHWNKLKSAQLVCGNESWINLMYAYVCLVVDIGPAHAREDVEVEKWKGVPPKAT